MIPSHDTRRSPFATRSPTAPATPRMAGTFSPISLVTDLPLLSPTNGRPARTSTLCGDSSNRTTFTPPQSPSGKSGTTEDSTKRARRRPNIPPTLTHEPVVHRRDDGRPVGDVDIDHTRAFQPFGHIGTRLDLGARAGSRNFLSVFRHVLDMERQRFPSAADRFLHRVAVRNATGEIREADAEIRLVVAVDQRDIAHSALRYRQPACL